LLRNQLITVGLVLLGLIVLSLAFGLKGTRPADAADPGLENGINAMVQSLVAANNRQDVGAVLALFTDKGFQEFFSESKAEGAVDSELVSDPVTLRSVRNIMATSTGANATADFEVGLGIVSFDLNFVLQNGRWYIDASKTGSAAVDAGTSVVNLKLQEYAFVYDKEAASGGNIAFAAQNVGKQQHEMVLAKVDESVSVPELLDTLSSEDQSGPPPFEDFGFLGFLEPGQSATVALAHPLEPGKYVFLCFVSDAVDGVPHAFKGMASDFTVGGGTSPITPPSTGDGGVVGSSGSLNYALLALGLLLLTLGLGSSFRTARRT
jgi:uncharacterized cupredoxin-like copper-binding protein